MTVTTDPRAGACTAALPGWQQAIGREGAPVGPRRRPAGHPDHQAHQPHLLRPGGLHLRVAGGRRPRQRLPLRRGIVPGPKGIITGGYDNETAGTVAIRHGEAVNAAALIAMFRPVIAGNRAGGWRELRQHADPR